MNKRDKIQYQIKYGVINNETLHFVNIEHMMHKHMRPTEVTVLFSTIMITVHESCNGRKNE